MCVYIQTFVYTHTYIYKYIYINFNIHTNHIKPPPTHWASAPPTPPQSVSECRAESKAPAGCARHGPQPKREGIHGGP